MSYSTFLLDLDHTLFDTEASEVAAFEQTMFSADIDEPRLYWQDFQNINLELWAAVERGEILPAMLYH